MVGDDDCGCFLLTLDCSNGTDLLLFFFVSLENFLRRRKPDDPLLAVLVVLFTLPMLLRRPVLLSLLVPALLFMDGLLGLELVVSEDSLRSDDLLVDVVDDDVNVVWCGS